MHLNPRAGDLAFVSQSGALVTAVLDWAEALAKLSGLLIAGPEIDELDIKPLDRKACWRSTPHRHSGAWRLCIGFEHEVEIDGGRRLLVRPIRPENEPLLIEMVAQSSPPPPSGEETPSVDQGTAAARLGVSRIIADPENERAEFAVMVRSDMKGRGLGFQLMKDILACARKRGTKAVHGEVLAENRQCFRWQTSWVLSATVRKAVWYRSLCGSSEAVSKHSAIAPLRQIKVREKEYDKEAGPAFEGSHGEQEIAMLPAEFVQIRLELAREPGHPEGDRQTGYELIAPLDAEGRLMPNSWKSHRHECRVRHFRHGEDDRIGSLRRHPGGSWYFDYDRDRREDDETGYRLSDEKFVVGEYVSIPDEHRKMHTYRVVSVRPA